VSHDPAVQVEELVDRDRPVVEPQGQPKPIV
jgi:hypothetical protein